MKELISVIVPVYNVKPYLRKCIDSICSQTIKNLEIILVDDGSNDGSEVICDEFQQKDRRIVVIHQENAGESSARNTGLSYAKGKYIGFIDSDDYIEVNMLEELYGNLVYYAADISICSDVYEDEEGNILNSKIMEEAVLHDKEAFKYFFRDKISGGVCNKLFKKSIVDRYKLNFNKSIKYGPDILFLGEYLYYSNTSVIINKVLYHYVYHTLSICNKMRTDNVFDLKYITSVRGIQLLKPYVDKTSNKQIEDAYHVMLACRYGNLVYKMLSLQYKDNELYVEAKKYLRSVWTLYVRSNDVIKKTKFMLLVFSINKVMSKVLVGLIEIKNRKRQ